MCQWVMEGNGWVKLLGAGGYSDPKSEPTLKCRLSSASIKDKVVYDSSSPFDFTGYKNILNTCYSQV